MHSLFCSDLPTCSYDLPPPLRTPELFSILWVLLGGRQCPSVVSKGVTCCPLDFTFSCACYDVFHTTHLTEFIANVTDSLGAPSLPTYSLCFSGDYVSWNQWTYICSCYFCIRLVLGPFPPSFFPAENVADKQFSCLHHDYYHPRPCCTCLYNLSGFSFLVQYWWSQLLRPHIWIW